MGTICAAIANFSGNVDRGKKPRGLTAADFVPDFDRTEKSPEEMIQMMKLLPRAREK